MKTLFKNNNRFQYFFYALIILIISFLLMIIYTMNGFSSQKVINYFFRNDFTEVNELIDNETLHNYINDFAVNKNNLALPESYGNIYFSEKNIFSFEINGDIGDNSKYSLYYSKDEEPFNENNLFRGNIENKSIKVGLVGKYNYRLEIIGVNSIRSIIINPQEDLLEYNFSILIVSAAIFLLLYLLNNKMDYMYGFKLAFQDLCNDIKKFIENHKFDLIIIIILAFVTFVYELCNFTISIDEEAMMLNYEGYPESFLIPKRGLLFLLKKLFFFNKKIIPGFTTCLAFIAIILASMIWGMLFEVASNKKLKTISLVSFCCIFFSAPYAIPHYFSFSTYNFEVGLGMIFCSLANYFLLKSFLNKNKIFLIISTIFLLFTVSVYQALIPMYIVSVCGCLLLISYSFYTTTIKSFLFKVIQSIFCLSIATILSNFIQSLILKLMKSKATLNYLDTFLGWEGGLKNGIIQTWQSTLSVILGNFKYYGFPPLVSYILLIIVLLFLIVKIKPFSNRITFFICGLGIAVSPFLISFAFATTYIPLRTLQGLALMSGFVWLVFLEFVNIPKLKALTTIFAISIMLNQMGTVNHLFYSDNMRYQFDQSVAYQLYYDINKLNSKKPVVFIGNYSHEHSMYILKWDTIGTSIFERDFGRSKSIHSFFNALDVPITSSQNSDFFDEALVYSADMNCWPQNGSVIEKEDIVVVKLSEPKEEWRLSQ